MSKVPWVKVNPDDAMTLIEEVLRLAHDMEADYSSRYANLLNVLQRSSGEFATKLRLHLEVEKETAALAVKLMTAYADAMKRTVDEIQKFDALQAKSAFRLGA